LIAGVPMILLCRTLLEDKMLREELAGYKEYAAQVKYRLALGIW
jgi:protein-S-isoprenylcysteine O-methyltransferase Ste14